MSRITQHCIVIDDEDQTSKMDDLVRDMRSENVELTYIQINPISKKYYHLNSETEESTFDIEMMYRDIKVEIKKGVRMIACDNGLTVVKGYDVIHTIRMKLKYKYHIILYSGTIDVVINNIFQQEDKVSEVKKLVQCNIKDFLIRDSYVDSLKNHLRHATFDIEAEIVQWLNAFADHKFIGHPSLQRNTLGQVADAIENDKPLGIKFQKLFVEQGIATMIKLNKLPNNE
jgi:hypothetical protein